MIAKLFLAVVAASLVWTVDDVTSYILAALAAIVIITAPTGAESDRP